MVSRGNTVLWDVKGRGYWGERGMVEGQRHGGMKVCGCG